MAAGYQVEMRQVLLLVSVAFPFSEPDIWVECDIVRAFHIFTCIIPVLFYLLCKPRLWKGAGGVSDTSSQMILCCLPLPDVEGSGVPSVKNKVVLGVWFSYSTLR